MTGGKMINSVRKVNKPWGFEEIFAETEQYVGKILNIDPGHRLSLQYHEEKEETLYVIQGTLTIWNSEDDMSYMLCGPGSVYHVKPGQVHRFGADENEREMVRILEVSTPQLDDVVRLADDYKR